MFQVLILKNPPELFPLGIVRYLIHEEDISSNVFVRLSIVLHLVHHILLANLAAAPEDDCRVDDVVTLLPVVRAPDGGLHHPGHLLDDVLQLAGSHPARGHLDDLLGSVLEVQFPLVVVVAQVASVREAVPSEELLVGLVPVDVALHHGQSAGHDLARLPRPQPGPRVRVSDVDRGVGHQHSQAAGGHVEGPGDSTHLVRVVMIVTGGGVTSVLP